MSEFRAIEQPRINIDVEYQISIIFLSDDPDDQNKFLEKLSKYAAKKGEGTHHEKIQGIHVKYSVILKTLSLPLKMKTR